MTVIAFIAAGLIVSVLVSIVFCWRAPTMHRGDLFDMSDLDDLSRDLPFWRDFDQ